MEYEYIGFAESVLESILSYSSVNSLLRLASYVFCALSLYTIAQRRCIRKAWLAWVPVLNVWILGSISDQYRYVAKGEVRNKRKVLLTVSILQIIVAAVAAIKLAVNLALAVAGVAQGCDEMEVIRWFLSSLAYFVPVAILSLVGLVFRAMALYDLYSSCEPANNVLYLILSIIPGISHITRPLFLFLCRNQDGGMPPRREENA